MALVTCEDGAVTYVTLVTHVTQAVTHNGELTMKSDLSHVWMAL